MDENDYFLKTKNVHQKIDHMPSHDQQPKKYLEAEEILLQQ